MLVHLKKLIGLFIILGGFFISSCVPYPGVKPNSSQYSLVCQCNLDLKYVAGKGSNEQEALSSAQEKCSAIFPEAALSNCKRP